MIVYQEAGVAERMKKCIRTQRVTRSRLWRFGTLSTELLAGCYHVSIGIERSPRVRTFGVEFLDHVRLKTLTSVDASSVTFHINRSKNTGRPCIHGAMTCILWHSGVAALWSKYCRDMTADYESDFRHQQT